MRPSSISKFWRTLFAAVLMITGRSITATAQSTDLTTEFLEGEVQMVDFTHEVTRFRVVSNDAIIEVRNDIHLRLVDNPYALPETFRILAPMTAVRTIEGSIPANYVRIYPLKHYIALRDKYEKHATPLKPSEAAEKIISKGDADYIFTLDRNGWEAYTKQMVYPDGWKIQLRPLDSGTGIMAFDPITGFGLSVQPLYSNGDGPPDILIVGSYYPLGTLPEFSDEFKKDVEQEASDDLGDDYTITASHTRIPPFEGIELTVTKR